MRTLVIGIGTAGVNVLNTLHDEMVNDLIARQEDEIEYGAITREVDDIHFFAIESSTGDSAHNIAESKSFRHTNSYKYHLLKAPSNFNRDIRDHPYLLPDLEVSGQGAKRNRVISRYFVDSTDEFTRNDNLFSKLSDELTYLYGANSNTARIWIIHSLSGGTGSGLFPLISMWLRNQFFNYRTTNPHFDLFMCGIGFYSKLQNNSTSNMLRGEERLYSNSFAAMRELNKLLWPDSPHIDINPTLTLYSEMNPNDRTIELERNNMGSLPALDKYFLVGVDEKKALDKTYLNRINIMSVECLRNLLFQSENQGLLDRAAEGRLGSFDEREVRINYEGLKEYITLIGEIQEDKEKCVTFNMSYDKDNALYEKLYEKYSKKISTEKSDYERHENILSLKDFLSLKLSNTTGIISTVFGDRKTLKKQISQLENLANLESTKKQIKANELKLQVLFDKLTKFENRDECIIIPFNKETIKRENIEKLSEEENTNSIQYLIENKYINKEHLVSSSKKQYDLSIRELEVFVSDVFSKDLHDDRVRTKTFLLENNPDLANEANITTVDINSVNWVDTYTLKYVSYRTGLSFKALNFYVEMQNVYRSGTLSEYDNRFQLTEKGGGLGRIFAYPEFFVDDPRVMCAYPKYLEQEIGELNWDKYWEDWTKDKNILERGIMQNYLPDMAADHEE